MGESTGRGWRRCQPELICRLTGVKGPIQDAHVADHLLVSARTPEGVDRSSWSRSHTPGAFGHAAHAASIWLVGSPGFASTRVLVPAVGGGRARWMRRADAMRAAARAGGGFAVRRDGWRYRPSI